MGERGAGPEFAPATLVAPTSAWLVAAGWHLPFLARWVYEHHVLELLDHIDEVEGSVAGGDELVVMPVPVARWGCLLASGAQVRWIPGVVADPPGVLPGRVFLLVQVPRPPWLIT